MNGIIIMNELNRHSLAGLYGLRQMAQAQLTCSAVGSDERRIALANLENIDRELNQRLAECLPQI